MRECQKNNISKPFRNVAIKDSQNSRGKSENEDKKNSNDSKEYKESHEFLNFHRVRENLDSKGSRPSREKSENKDEENMSTNLDIRIKARESDSNIKISDCERADSNSKNRKENINYGIGNLRIKFSRPPPQFNKEVNFNKTHKFNGMKITAVDSISLSKATLPKKDSNQISNILQSRKTGINGQKDSYNVDNSLNSNEVKLSNNSDTSNNKTPSLKKNDLKGYINSFSNKAAIHNVKLQLKKLKNENKKLKVPTPKIVIKQNDALQNQTSESKSKENISTLCISGNSKNNIRNYIFSKSIGQGAYATVKLAVNISTNEKVAIKIYEKDKLIEPQRYKSVQREIKLLEKVKHPNIVKFHEAFDNNSQVF